MFKALVLISVFAAAACVELEEVFEWDQLPFDWKDEKQKEEWTAKKIYIQENNLPLGVDRWQDKLFITVPRLVIYLNN